MDIIKLTITTDLNKNPVLDSLLKQLDISHNVKVNTSSANSAVATLGQNIKSAFDGVTNGLMKADLALGGAARVFNLLKGAVSFFTQPASEIEQLRLRLVSLYGSTEAAANAFDKFQDIASRTPATLQQVVEAGASLKAFGMDSENTLESVSDLAAYMGLDVVEAASAVGRAFAGGVGAADILRERGVLQLIKSFKGIDDLTQLTLPEFREALISSLSDPAAGIAGSADRIAKSYAGAMSNLNDAFGILKANIGKNLTPAFAEMANGIGSVIKNLNGMGSNLQIASGKAVEQRTKFESLVITYESLHTKQNRSITDNQLYKGAIDQLLSQYPNYFKNIDLEKGKWSDISTAINTARDSLQNYLNLQIQEAVTKDFTEDINKARAKIIKLTTEINEINGKIASGAAKATDIMYYTASGYATYQDEINRLKTNIASTEKQEKNLNIQLQNRLKTTKQLYNVIPPVTPAVTTANTTPATSASSADRGRGVSITGLSSLRTVRAVFPHTALQKTGISFKRLA